MSAILEIFLGMTRALLGAMFVVGGRIVVVSAASAGGAYLMRRAFGRFKRRP